MRRPETSIRRALRAGVAATAFAAAFAALFASAPAQADGAAKRALRLGAGEHGGFSRVVVEGGPRGGWSLLSGQRRFDLRLPGEGYDIRHDAVTRQRRAHRVTALRTRREAGETILSFSLNCDCAAAARVGGSGLLIIDVKPRTTTAEARIANENAGAIETASVGAETSPLDVEGARNFLMEQLKRAAEQGLISYKKPKGAEAPATAAHAAAAQEEHAADRQAPASPTGSAIELSPESGGAPSHDSKPATNEAATNEAAAHAPAGHAPHAAEEKPAYDKASLKDFFSAKHAAKSEEASGPEEIPHGGGDAAKAGSSEAPKKAQVGVVAETPRRHAAPAKSEHAEHATANDGHGGDGAAHAQAKVEERTAPTPCPPEEPLDPRNWPYAEKYNEALAERRSALFDGLNRLDPSAVAELQMLYLAHGFGYEAAAAPAGFGVEDETVALLAALGDAVAGRTPAKGSAFNRAQPCPGRQAFWQAIALAGSEPRRAVEAYKRSERALWRTPTDLRRLYGERIALAATRAGELETAAGILALLERSQKDPTPTLRLVRAELALAEGRTIAAQSELEKVARSRDENNLEAALQLADSFGQPYEGERALDLADLLADFAMQRRGGPDMVRAISAEALLRARYGRLPDAITAVEVSMRYGGYGEEALEALRVALLDEAVAALAPREPRSAQNPAQNSHANGSQRSAVKAAAHKADAHAAHPVKPKRKPLRRSAARDKEALALAAQLVEQIADLPAGESNDRIRTDLAEQVVAIGAPHLARLLIDDALAERLPRAAVARKEAADAAALIDPLGALSGGAETGHGAGRTGVEPLLSELEAAEARALAQMSAPTEAEEAVKPDPSLEKLREGKHMAEQPAENIEAAQSLLDDLKQDLTLLRDLAARQKKAPAPETAPAAAPDAAKGEADG